MRFGLLLLLAGCRNILGLHDPQLIADAQFDGATRDGCTSFSMFIDTCALPAGAPMPPDASAYNSDTGMVTSGSAPVAMPHMMLTSTQGDVVDAVAIDADWVELSAMRITGKLPVVFAVVGDVTINGTLDLSAGGAGAGCVHGAGVDATSVYGGGGGGGAATSLGSGGAGGGSPNSGGLAQTTFTGGCSGGKGGGTILSSGGAGAGGGALYIVATNNIVVDGTLDVSGGGGLGGAGDGIFNNNVGGGGGGGGGGSLRFEAPTISIGQDSMLEAGGGGGGGGGYQTNGLAGKTGLLGGTGGTAEDNAGGNGARLIAAKPGADGGAGGGGGGGGGDGSIHFATTPIQLKGVVIPPAN